MKIPIFFIIEGDLSLFTNIGFALRSGPDPPHQHPKKTFASIPAEVIVVAICGAIVARKK
jgi:hypothetical protein